MNPDMEIRIEITMPNSRKRLCFGMRLSEHVFSESFAPLPRDRELSFAVESRMRAAKQKEMRRFLARNMAEDFAAKFLETIEKEDPQNGFTPQEWAEINPKEQP